MDYIFCARNTQGGSFGNNPGPTKYLEIPERDAHVSPAQAIPRRAWFDRVTAEAEVRRNPHNQPVGDVLIYVHGFNVSQAVMLERHRSIRAGLEADGFKGVVVSYDWPSSNQAINYLPDRVDAKATAIRLVSDGIGPFSRFIDQGCEISVHLLVHSMGAYVLREAFDDADDRPAVAATSWTVSQVMMASADVSSDSMGVTASSSSLYRHCVRLTNYSNPYDAVLSISGVKRVGVSPRVGRIGLPEGAPPKAVNVEVGDYYDANRASFAHIPNSDHSFYFYDQTFLQDVHFTLKGEIDRAAIPTRVLRDGKLHLKV
jgi:Alpha/beta hydrolase of unknown function (DUF900)